MSSTFTSRLKLERQASGANSGNWGNLVNFVLNRIDSSVRGYVAVNVAGTANVTLVSNNSTSNTDDSTTDDQVHNKVIEFTGALGANINVFTDAAEGEYVLFNNTTGAYSLTFGNTGHAANGVAVTQGTKSIVYTDGSTIYDVGSDLGAVGVDSLTSTGNVNLTAASSLVLQDTTGGQFAALKAAGTTTSYTLTLPPATGSADQIIKTDGSGNLSFADMSGGSVSWNTTPVTANATITAGTGVFANTTGGAFVLTLPASPSAGDFAAIKDYASTFASNNITVNRNGSKIDGFTNNVALNVTGQSVAFIYVDSTQGWKAVNDDSSSFAPEYITATGGSISNSGDFRIHTFTSPGTFEVTKKGNSLGNDKLGYVIVAGGGGGSSTNSTDDGAGGGAGGYREAKDACDPYTASPLAASAITLCNTGSYGIVVGNGGAGGPGTSGVSGTTGSCSSFNSIIGAGGGAARASSSAAPPSVANGGSGGGSGGGAGVPGKPGGTGNTPSTTPPQGQNGGNGASSPPDGSAGGGGGAGSAGGNAGGSSANGGSGATSSINASPVARAGGGGAATASGQDGGGPSGTSGTANTGGGGGGNQQGGAAGDGGTGLVIIRYKFQN